MMNAVPSLRRRRSVRGFTLVELLTVIAIIGILATILIPAVGGVRKKAGMTKSSSNLRQIGLSYQAFSESGTRKINITEGTWVSTGGGRQANNPAEFAQVLADRADLNDASVYIIDIDPNLSTVTTIPRQIITRDGNTVGLAPGWTGAGGIVSAGAIGYEFVANVANNAPSSTTPLGWTRGLESSGRWGDSNPWGSQEGGHLLFLDGHVEYHQNLLGDSGTGVLVDDTGTATFEVEKAINPTKVTTEGAEPTVLKFASSGGGE